MIEEILNDVKIRMQQAITHVKNELNKVRTGRANPEMFNALLVDYYGNPTPINQVSTISVPEPRLITLTPYEKPLFTTMYINIKQKTTNFGPIKTSFIKPSPKDLQIPGAKNITSEISKMNYKF